MLKLVRSAIVVSFLSLGFPFAVFAAQTVDINSADAATLAQNINGIGASKAQAIVDYRNENGRFLAVDDLVNVKGIGIKTVNRIREFLTVSPDTVDATPAKIKPAKPATTEQPALPAN